MHLLAISNLLVGRFFCILLPVSCASNAKSLPIWCRRIRLCADINSDRARLLSDGVTPVTRTVVDRNIDVHIHIHVDLRRSLHLL